VTMKDAKAKAGGRLAFRYGGFSVGLDVAPGAARAEVLARLEAALLAQQDSMRTESDGAVTRFMVHRFEPVSPAEREEREEALAVVDGLFPER